MGGNSSAISEEQLTALVAERRPGWTLPRPFYVDKDIFRVDLERVWRRYWLFAGHTSQIRNPGDFFTWTVAEEPVTNFANAVYKGLAIAQASDGNTYLYATNFRSGRVEVYNSNFKPSYL